MAITQRYKEAQSDASLALQTPGLGDPRYKRGPVVLVRKVTPSFGCGKFYLAGRRVPYDPTLCLLV